MQRYSILTAMQGLQARQVSPEQFTQKLAESVTQLEQAVAGITGER